MLHAKGGCGEKNKKGIAEKPARKKRPKIGGEQDRLERAPFGTAVTRSTGLLQAT